MFRTASAERPAILFRNRSRRTFTLVCTQSAIIIFTPIAAVSRIAMEANKYRPASRSRKLATRFKTVPAANSTLDFIGGIAEFVITRRPMLRRS